MVKKKIVGGNFFSIYKNFKFRSTHGSVEKRKKLRHTGWWWWVLNLAIFLHLCTYFSYRHSFRGFLKKWIFSFSFFLFGSYFSVEVTYSYCLSHFFSALHMRRRLLEFFFFFGAILDCFFFFSRYFSDKEIASFPIGSIFGFSWNKMSCQLYSFSYYSCIVQFFENDEKSMEFLRSHGVLPTTVTCAHCKSLCYFRRDQKIRRCQKRISVPKSKKTTCRFTISDFKGSFCWIPIFRLGKLFYLLITTSAISGTTGLCWNA